MTTIALYAFSSVIVVSLISLVGIITLSWKESFLHKSVFFLVSLAVGALFGDALIHLIPEAFESALNPTLVSLWILTGILAFFVLEKFLRWHHGHGKECAGDHVHGPKCTPDGEIAGRIKPLGFLVVISDGIHNLIDGIIIGVSYLVSVEVGVATTIAIILHEIPQEISDFGILLHAGFTKARALLVNFLSALLAVVGVGIVFVIGETIETTVPAILALAAGGFLYIAGSDLVPELHKTRDLKRSLVQFFAILLGITLMFLLLLFEK